MQTVFDIECTRQFKTLKDADEKTQIAWNAICSKFPDLTPAESYEQKANFFPEFGRIICISVLTKADAGSPKSFFLPSKEIEAEKLVLQSFYDWIKEAGSLQLIGHNIKKFDIPYINVRSMAHGLPINHNLKTFGIKPWELYHVDTWEAWKGGIFGSSQSAALTSICHTLGIETPKDDIGGAEVPNLFFSDEPDAVERIVKYCEKDVIATAKIYNELHKLNAL